MCSVGNFYVIEGVDGVGKTTMAKLLVKHLEGIYYKTPPEPYASRYFEFDGTNTRKRFEFFLESIVYASQEIRLLLKEGISVVADRWIWTTLAYHIQQDRMLRAEVSRATKKVLLPQKAFLIRVHPDVWRTRVLQRGPLSFTDRRLFDNPMCINELNDLFKEVNPDFVVIDSQDLIEDTYKAILMHIEVE